MNFTEIKQIIFLGNIILDFLLEEEEDSLKEKILDYNYINIKQIESYMEEFQRDFGELKNQEYQAFQEKIFFLTEKYHNHRSNGLKNLNNNDFFELIYQYHDVKTQIKNKYREIWTEFNLNLMFIGLFIMIISFLTVFFLFDFIDYNIQTDCRFLSNDLFSFEDLLKQIKTNVLIIFFLYVFSLIYEIEFLFISSIFTLVQALLFLFYCFKNARNLRKVIIQKEKKILEIKCVFEQNLFATIIFWILNISHGYMLFAVSHIRNEGQAILFVLIFVNFLYICLTLSKNECKIRQKLIIIMEIAFLTILLYFAGFYENNMFNRNDITLKKVFFFINLFFIN